LGFLGIGLEEKKNRKNAPIISKEKKSVAVRVIHTDEEWMIAKTVSRILNITKK
jgi:acetate kinase